MTDAPAPERRAALVYNPTKVDADQLRALVAEHASAAGWAEPLFYETSVDDLGDGVTREALDAGASVVLVAGGDGTVRAVSQAMANSHVPLTIVPSGTGNLLARNLGLPLTDPAAMVAAAFDGEVHAIDVGYARLTRADGDHEEHAFVVMGGIGLDAAMIANTSGVCQTKTIASRRSAVSDRMDVVARCASAWRSGSSAVTAIRLTKNADTTNEAAFIAKAAR